MHEKLEKSPRTAINVSKKPVPAAQKANEMEVAKGSSTLGVRSRMQRLEESVAR